MNKFMIIPVSRETEKEWAKMCVALFGKSFVERLKEGRDKNFENEFVYMLNGEAVAFLNVSLRNDYVEGTSSNPVGYLEAIYVKPEFRYQGIARQMVEFAKQWSIENGCKEIASDCLIENEESRRFHNKIGFEEANVIVCFTMELNNGLHN